MKPKMRLMNIMLLTAAVLLAFIFAIQGCKKKSEPAPAPVPSKNVMDTAADVQKKVSDVIAQKTCPIMDGNPINKDLFIEYKGQKVYFCCPACIEKFNAEPEKYMDKLPQFKK